MQIPGNMWVEVWQSAKPVPARRQRRLFDDTKEAEKVGTWLDKTFENDDEHALVAALVATTLYGNLFPPSSVAVLGSTLVSFHEASWCGSQTYASANTCCYSQTDRARLGLFLYFQLWAQKPEPWPTYALCYHAYRGEWTSYNEDCDQPNYKQGNQGDAITKHWSTPLWGQCPVSSA